MVGGVGWFRLELNFSMFYGLSKFLPGEEFIMCLKKSPGIFRGFRRKKSPRFLRVDRDNVPIKA